MNNTSALTDGDLTTLNGFLARVDGGEIPNAEALDGFFAALACCPDLIMPSEYMPYIQNGADEDGDLNFESIGEAKQFMELVNQHWNYVNDLLSKGSLETGDVYLPLVVENEKGEYRGNDWAKGFLSGTHLRGDIWSNLINDEEKGGFMISIMTLAYENDPDPKMRPFKEPINDEKRDTILATAAAGVIWMHKHFLNQRSVYMPKTGTFVRSGKKVGRNDPCPCGSGKKYKLCCINGPTLH